MSDYRNSISSIESGGKYNLMGPVTRNGDRAYGKYQVMGRNVPEWTRAALGRAMTPQEFLNDQQAQDATFDHRFGMYAAKYGPENAAKAWFAGEKGMNNPNARDQLGTSVADYGARFMKGLGKSQVAQQSAPEPSNVSAFDQYPQMDAQDMARTVGDNNASRKNPSQSQAKAPSYQASLINDIIAQEQPSGGNADPRSNIVTAGYVPKKAPKTDIPPFRGEDVGAATHPSQGREPAQGRVIGEDAENATHPSQGEVIGSGSDWVDAGNKEMAAPIESKPGTNRTQSQPHMTPSAEEDLLRQIEEASGIDRNGNPTFPPRDAGPQPNVQRKPNAGDILTMGGGPAVAATAGAGAKPAQSDPALEAVQKQVQVGQNSAPAWLQMAMQEIAPNVAKTVATDPAAAQAAQVLSQKVIASQAGADSQKYGPGQSSPILQTMIKQAQQQAPAGPGPRNNDIPMPQPQQQPMNAPVDFYNRGGGGANQGWSGGYYE